MSYAQALIKTPLNYTSMRSMSPALAELNPAGTCFSMCCLWVKELLRDANLSSAVLKEKMCLSIMTLALRHKRFITEVDAPGTSQAQRIAAWKRQLDVFGLTSASLTPGQGAGAARVPESRSVKDRASFLEAYLGFGFSGAAVGDMWGVLWKFLGMQPRPYACVFNAYQGSDRNHGGHTISAYIPAGGPLRIRVFDMNAGEFLIENADQWRIWSNGLDGSMEGDHKGLFNFVDVMDLRLK